MMMLIVSAIIEILAFSVISQYWDRLCNYMNPGYFTLAAIDLKP